MLTYLEIKYGVLFLYFLSSEWGDNNQLITPNWRGYLSGKIRLPDLAIIVELIKALFPHFSFSWIKRGLSFVKFPFNCNKIGALKFTKILMISFNYLCNFGESTEEGGVHFNFNTMTNFSNITHPFLLVAGGVPSTTIPSWRMAYISSGTNRGCGTSGKRCGTVPSGYCEQA